ncbi:MAG: glucose-6-phosphate dehydrogenase [Acidobacteria bacterium]|nr:MAG: glucose-6-phosphate dehydrogenase [Acidobacteriota bacterium]
MDDSLGLSGPQAARGGRRSASRCPHAPLAWPDHRGGRMTISNLLVLGVTGDLTSRLLLPGLASLAVHRELPEGFRLTGAAVNDWDTGQFRHYVRESLGADGPESAAALEDLAARAAYHRADVTDPGQVRELVRSVTREGPVGIYLALPTGLIQEAVRALEGVALPPGSRLAIEKPFGHDASSAQELNASLSRVVGPLGERAVYRVDHVLAMSSLHNLLTLRMENRPLAATWSARDIARVEILWDETIDAHGRAAYYDRAGALRDVMQNHMVQVLCWVAMEPPEELTDEALDEAELEVLRRTRVVRDPSGHFMARRARYTSGVLARTGGAHGGRVEDYVDLEGVDPARDTETLAEVVLEVDLPRWRGTTFVMRAGKALAERRKGVLVHYRPSGTGRRHTPGDRPGVDNRLWIGIDGPDEVRLGLRGSALSPRPEHRPLLLTARVPPTGHPPYGNVLLDFLSGGSAHAVSAQEPVEAWRIFEPVLAEWDDPGSPMGAYMAGTAPQA